MISWELFFYWNWWSILQFLALTRLFIGAPPVWLFITSCSMLLPWCILDLLDLMIDELHFQAFMNSLIGWGGRYGSLVNLVFCTHIYCIDCCYDFTVLATRFFFFCWCIVDPCNEFET